MAIAGEVSAVRLRAKSMAIGFTFNYFFSTVWNVAIPYLYNTYDVTGPITTVVSRHDMNSVRRLRDDRE